MCAVPAWSNAALKSDGYIGASKDGGRLLTQRLPQGRIILNVRLYIPFIALTLNVFTLFSLEFYNTLSLKTPTAIQRGAFLFFFPSRCYFSPTNATLFLWPFPTHNHPISLSILLFYVVSNLFNVLLSVFSPFSVSALHPNPSYALYPLWLHPYALLRSPKSMMTHKTSNQLCLQRVLPF